MKWEDFFLENEVGNFVLAVIQFAFTIFYFFLKEFAFTIGITLRLRTKWRPSGHYTIPYSCSNTLFLPQPNFNLPLVSPLMPFISIKI